MKKRSLVLGVILTLSCCMGAYASDDIWPLTDSVGLVVRDYMDAGYEPHKGIDIVYDETTPICAPIGGTVKTLEHDDSNDTYFVLITSDEQGDSVILCNLAEVEVSEGDVVSAGDEIGLVGDECLHVEYMPQGFGRGDSVNPTDFLTEGGTKLEYPEME